MATEIDRVDGRRGWWDRQRVTVLRVAVVVMAVLALLKLGTEFYRLLGDNRRQGAAEWSYGNLHSWAGVWGLEKWNSPLSLLALAVFGWWAYGHRHGDLWVLLGVTALVARFWTYHGVSVNQTDFFLALIICWRMNGRAYSWKPGRRRSRS